MLLSSWLAVIAIFSMIVLAAGTFSQQTRNMQTAHAVEQYTPCNCVIFRFDDITDASLPKAKITMMNDFIDRGIPLSLGVVAAHLGNYPSTGVYNKTIEGVNSGLFDVTIHGNSHDDYSMMNLTAQRSELSAAEQHIESLFGAKSRIFMPPYNRYNQDTLTVLAEQGMSVMATTVTIDNNVTNKYFLTDGNATKDEFYTHNSKLRISDVNGKLIYHIGHNLASFTAMHDANKFGQAAENEIEKRVQQSIADRAYGVVVLHPYDFVNVVNGTNQDSINATRYQELTDVINWVVARYPTTSYSKLMGTTWYLNQLPAKPLLNQTLKLVIANEVFDIRYNTTNASTKTQNITADTSSKSLSVMIYSPESAGMLTIELPRKVIDSRTEPHKTPDCWITASNGSRIYNYCDKDKEFLVTVNSDETPFYSTTTVNIGSDVDSRTLRIEYPKGISIVQISGTYVVPEFGSLAVFTMIVTFASAIIIARMTGKRLAK